MPASTSSAVNKTLKRKLPPTPPAPITSTSSTSVTPSQASRPPKKQRTKPVPSSAASLPPPAQPIASTSALPPPALPQPTLTPPITRRRKLTPSRPLAAGLPPGSAVTGPTAQILGRSTVLVSKRTSLGSYMRRCKALILVEGISTLTLTSLSSSIPHLLTLLHALLAILPFPPSAVTYELKTTSVRVTDEVVPEDEEEEIRVEGRWVSGLECVVRIGGGGVRGGKMVGMGMGIGGGEKKGRKGGEGRGNQKGGREKKKGRKRDGGGDKTGAVSGGGGSAKVVVEVVEDDEMDAMNG